ncbi:MAG: acylphosphatase [Gammaproteobacteria bacterium]
MKTRHYLVEGRVQGVYYRQSTRLEAARLGLAGWVRNLPDGRVEVLARGASDGLEAFERWLAQGPSRAQVTRVSAQDSDAAVGDDFVVC